MPDSANDPSNSKASPVWTWGVPASPIVAALLPVILQLNQLQTIVVGAVAGIYIICGAAVQIITSLGASRIRTAEVSSPPVVQSANTVQVGSVPAAGGSA